ncbi:MAG: hypothetical protein AAGA03_02040 [Planctomycetota bacterium]
MAKTVIALVLAIAGCFAFVNLLCLGNMGILEQEINSYNSPANKSTKFEAFHPENNGWFYDNLPGAGGSGSGASGGDVSSNPFVETP